MMPTKECGICSFLKQGIKTGIRKPKESNLLQSGKFCSNNRSVNFRQDIKSLYGSCSDFEGVTL